MSGMKRHISCGLAVAVLAVGSAATRADLASVAAQIGATLDLKNLAADGIPRQIIGGYEGSGYQLTPLDATDYDYAQPSPMGADAGELRDFHWIPENSGLGATDGSSGTMWDFGKKLSRQFILDPSIDHVPVPEEALETTLWGSNDGGATWILGTLDRLYAQGWHAGSIEDEPSSRWYFSSPVNLISATAGFTQGAYSYLSSDSEIDAVLPVPGAGLLGAFGLAVVGAIRRRFA